MRKAALLLASLGLLAAWPTAAPAPVPSGRDAAAAASWTSCTWSATVLTHGRRWKLDRLRTFGVGCPQAKRVARACIATRCPSGWKHKVDVVAGPPRVWWHSSWTYQVSPFAHVQWRARRG